MDDLKRMLANLLPSDGPDFADLADRYLGLYWRRVAIALAFIEDTLREQLQHLGFSYMAQTVILVATCLILAFGSFRIFPDKLRMISVLVFLALGFRILMPMLDS
ncbi:MAG TPA: hypothetical protein DDZ81_06810 [Acetobacteraceae bacterium]|jgi:hypothetical protein|nr:hypothetical protein [Acetobacteraceae bacterium]